MYEVIIAKKKPIEVNAFSFESVSKMFDDKQENGVFSINNYTIKKTSNKDLMKVQTLEGEVDFTNEDLLIIGVQGEIYPCKRNIFFQTYDVTDVTKATLGTKEDVSDN